MPKKSRSSLSITSPSEAFTHQSSEKTAYTGPIRMPGSDQQDAPICTCLTYSVSLSSDVSGIYAAAYNNNPNFFADFSSFAAIYDEYRYLGMELEFFPANRYSKVTTTCLPGAGVIDRDDTAVPSSLAALLHYESVKILSLEDPWTNRRDYRGSSVPSLTMKMDGTREAAWVTTATPISTGAIKVRFEGLSASTNYGLVLVRGLFQFRGRD